VQVKGTCEGAAKRTFGFMQLLSLTSPKSKMVVRSNRHLERR